MKLMMTILDFSLTSSKEFDTPFSQYKKSLLGTYEYD